MLPVEGGSRGGLACSSRQGRKGGWGLQRLCHSCYQPSPLRSVLGALLCLGVGGRSRAHSVPLEAVFLTSLVLLD